MPVHELRRIGVIVDVHHDLLSFLKSEQGPGKLTVVERRGDDVTRRQFDQASCDTQAVVGLALGGIVGRARGACDPPREWKEGAVSEQRAAVYVHVEAFPCERPYLLLKM